jgi:hypothetical protein
MPRKLRNPKQRIESEITESEQQWFLDEPFGCFTDPPADRATDLWAAYSEELLAKYRQKNGLFCRPSYWWEHDAPEPRRQLGDDTETQISYFARHPELQTPEEKSWLKSHKFSHWELLPVSEVADIPYLQAHPELLNDNELVAMKEHISLTTPQSRGIQ